MRLLFAFFLLFVSSAFAFDEKTVDIPTRPEITERALVVAPPDATATVILLAGSHGGLQITPAGTLRFGKGNFLVRSRGLFASQQLNAIVLDAPSDRQSPPFLDGGFRQTPEHAQDLKAVIAWARDQFKVPVWLVGTSRGTQSAAFAATQLRASEGPDGIVLTSTILRDPYSRAVPQMPLDAIRIPVLVVHHEQDGCKLCPYADVSWMMRKFENAPRKEAIGFTGGQDRGDPCEAFAHHGYNGIEREVVERIARWIHEGKSS